MHLVAYSSPSQARVADAEDIPDIDSVIADIIRHKEQLKQAAAEERKKYEQMSTNTTGNVTITTTSSPSQSSDVTSSDSTPSFFKRLATSLQSLSPRSKVKASSTSTSSCFNAMDNHDISDELKKLLESQGVNGEKSENGEDMSGWGSADKTTRRISMTSLGYDEEEEEEERGTNDSKSTGLETKQPKDQQRGRRRSAIANDVAEGDREEENDAIEAKKSSGAGPRRRSSVGGSIAGSQRKNSRKK